MIQIPKGKYFLLSFIPISTYLYVLYEDYWRKSNVSLKDIQDLVKHKDNTKFYKDILDKCDVKKNLCILSYEITRGAYEKITVDGIDEYMKKLKKDSSPFETGDKEDVFIFQEHEDPEETKKGNLFTLYDNSKLLNQKHVADTMDKLNELCGKGRCDLLKIMRQITTFCDENKDGGFVEYYWFDPKTQQTISKRSFVIKINDVEHNGVKRDLYIGSGHAIENISKEIDHFKISLLLGSSLFLLFFWKFLDLSKEIKNYKLANSILISSMIILSLFMFDKYKTSHKLETYNKLFSNNSISARILGALCASVAVFISLFRRNYNTVFYTVYVFTLVLLILSSIQISASDIETNRNILTFKYIANIMTTILLYIVFIFVIIVYK